jgi:hypothetical protein
MIGALVSTLVGPITGLLDKFIPDADTKAKLAHEIATMSVKQAHEAALAQIEVNKVEAGHRSTFVSGWRPSVGWCSSIALFWHFVAAPLLTFVAGWSGYPVPPLPAFDMDSLMTVLMGLLGLGGLRTFEKIKNVAK